MTRRKVLTTFVIAVMLSPIALDLLAATNLKSLSGDVLNFDNLAPRRILKSAAIEDRVNARKKTREFYQAMKEYQERTKRGEEGLVPPDINDYQSILSYIKDNNPPVQPKTVVPEKTHEAASEEKEVSSLQVEDLGEKERHLLRRYQRANSCPDSLKGYGLSGFYELCLSVTANPTGEARKGLLNPRQWLNKNKVYRPATMKLRMEMLQQALDRSGRRESVTPGRPDSYVK